VGGFIAAALPVFRQQGFGHFVNTASTAGIVIKPTMGGLCRHEVRRARRVKSASLLQERQEQAMRSAQ
jgi:NADP-dependent 3-hydroxy acid dehydrogenase YdfG